MAYVDFRHCIACGKGTNHTNDKCNECWKKAEDERVKNWESMSTEAKLTDIRERIECLERGGCFDS